MFKKGLFLFLFIVFIQQNAMSQTNIPAGDVSGKWTLAHSPYLINGDITVPDDSTLIIDPGVRVEFQGYYSLNVQGRLLGIRTQTDTTIVGVISFALPRARFHSYWRRIVEAGFGNRVMFRSDQMVWPEAIEYAIESIETADFLSEKQKRDILYNNAVRFFRLKDKKISQ